MLDPVKNFAKVVVSIGYDEYATEIVLSSGDGAKLPDPAVDGAFNLVWWNYTDYPNPSDDPNKEIVRCTARSTDTLTIIRAQEETLASTKNTVDKVYLMILAITAKMITDIGASFLSLDQTIPQTIINGFPIFEQGIQYTETTDPSGVADSLRTYAFDFHGITQFKYVDETNADVVLARDNIFVARNTSGVDIVKGKAVFICGATGNVPEICLAIANDPNLMPSCGMTFEDIDDNEYGRVMVVGILAINTDAWEENDILYVDPITAGELTNVAPSYPNLIQKMALVTVKGVGNGRIMVDREPLQFDETRLPHNLLSLTHPDTITALPQRGDLITGQLTPIQINSWTDLNNIRTNLGGNFVLTKNLTTDDPDYDGIGNNWLPLGSMFEPFSGTFDGYGHTIDGLIIPINGIPLQAGLFGITDWGATISNLGLTNVDITGASFVGGLVGQAMDCTINNCYVTGSVTGTGSTIGGLVGYNSGSITNCYTTTTVFGGGDATILGGLVGYTHGGSITNCYAIGDVTGNAPVGGLVGQEEMPLAPEWEPEVIYFKDSIVAYFVQYISLQDNNVGNQPDISPEWWAEYVPPPTIVNCGWYSHGIPEFAIGDPEGNVEYNELDNTVFYVATHDIYDTGDPVWDFNIIPIWMEDPVGGYPLLVGRSPDITTYWTRKGIGGIDTVLTSDGSDADWLAKSELTKQATTENIIYNGGFENWNDVTTFPPREAPLSWTQSETALESITAIEGDRDNLFPRTNQTQRYACRLITPEQLFNEVYIYQTLDNLKPNTTYYVHFRAKIGGEGEQARAWTTGGSSDLNVQVDATVWTDYYGTFTTDATPTTLDFKIGFVSASGDAGSLVIDNIIVTEGAYFSYSERPSDHHTWATDFQVATHAGEGTFTTNYKAQGTQRIERGRVFWNASEPPYPANPVHISFNTPFKKTPTIIVIPESINPNTDLFSVTIDIPSTNGLITGGFDMYFWQLTGVGIPPPWPDFPLVAPTINCYAQWIAIGVDNTP